MEPSSGCASSKPVCKYGQHCYRKNPTHFQEFSHPGVGKHGAAPDADEEPPPAKKAKESASELCSSGRLFWSKVRGIANRFNSPLDAIGIEDILSSWTGELIASAHFNYVFDVPWLLQQYPPAKRHTPILLVHGEKGEGLARLRAEAQPFKNIALQQARLDMPFGTHHSKMMLLEYGEGVRVVVHTANLVHKDWDQKTQGVWVSPLFTLLKETAGHSPSLFKQDLLEYLSVYGGAVGRWKEKLSLYDMSSARVRLIASVPGAHAGAHMHKWGHLKLRKVLESSGPADSSVKGWPVVAQFSSIGSLGQSDQTWVCSEWLCSLSSCQRETSCVQSLPPLQLVFPSVDDVRNSLEGYRAGGSIPYALQTFKKQPYLKNYMCRWKADETGRTRAAPHIKTYLRPSPDGSQLAWLLVTSANLSKAAWGVLEKRQTQLRIRSYEIGVLFLPCDEEKGGLASAGNVSFDLPLVPYRSQDEPWVWNIKYLTPDCCGNVWTP